MSDCEFCEQEKREHDSFSDLLTASINEAVKVIRDRSHYGVSFRCKECKRRVEPTEVFAMKNTPDHLEKEVYGVNENNHFGKSFVSDSDEKTDEPKFLQEGSLKHGME